MRVFLGTVGKSIFDILLLSIAEKKSLNDTRGKLEFEKGKHCIFQLSLQDFVTIFGYLFSFFVFFLFQLSSERFRHEIYPDRLIISVIFDRN